MFQLFGTWRVTYFLILFSTVTINVLGIPYDTGDVKINTERSTLSRRDLLTDITNSLPSSLRDDVTQGVYQNWWAGIPQDEAAIRKAFGVDNLDRLNAPVEFLNIPGYANYTSNTQTWNLRVRGQLHTQPYFVLPRNTQDSLAEAFVPDVNWNQLSPNEQDNARNLTGALFSVPKSGEQLRFHFKWAGESPGGPRGWGNGWEQRITFPDRTNTVGEVERFVGLRGDGLPDGHGEGGVVGVVDIWTEGIPTGNATGYLVQEEGITILSDIDDILRVTKIYDPQEALLNTFARDFTPWLNMPSVFAAWSSATPPSSSARSPYHFHYLTTTPEQATRVYMDFIYTHYPLGSFDTRPLSYSTPADAFASRSMLLQKIFETFPRRRFVLIGDTTNSDVLREYPQLASDFPGQVHCILIRNVSATEPENRLPYTVDGFRSVNRNSYMFFNTPQDLVGLNFYRGDCVNPNVRQYVGGNDGYGWRDLPGNGVLDDVLNSGSGIGRIGKEVYLGVGMVMGFFLLF